MTEPKKPETHAPPPTAKAAPAKKTPPSFAEVLRDVDPESLADERAALQAAYDALPTLPSPKDPKRAAFVTSLKEKIRLAVGKAEGSVTAAIDSLVNVEPLLKQLGDEIKALDEAHAAEEAAKKEPAK